MELQPPFILVFVLFILIINDAEHLQRLSIQSLFVCVYCDISMRVLLAESYRKTATVSALLSPSVFVLIFSLRLFTIYMVGTAVFIEACCSLFLGGCMHLLHKPFVLGPWSALSVGKKQ